MLTSGWLDALRRDLKFTKRVLTKNLAFSSTAIVTLALGIAASTVIFSVVDAVLLKPLDYNDSGDIYRVYTVDTVGLPRGSTGPPHVDPMAESGQSIQAAFYGYSFEQSVVNEEGTAFAVNEYRASEEFFQVFTEPLTLGRAFEPGDDFRNTVLSYQAWRDVFGSDPNIVGKPISVGSGPLERPRRGGRGLRVPRRHGNVDQDFHGTAGPASALQHAGLPACESRRFRRSGSGGARRVRGPVGALAGRSGARVRRSAVARGRRWRSAIDAADRVRRNDGPVD